MRSVLITQCLQQDFVGPIGPYDPLPNQLHVGHAEARRLLGADPSTGPVAQLMAWARAQPPDTLEIVHIRDWHDPGAPGEQDHLALFGPHCLRDTPGARLVLDLDAAIAGRPNEHLVDAIGLNDFEATDLADVLAGVIARAAGEPLRVAVVGVWTDAKVSFLLYDLKTRLRLDELATSSALTASASRARHFGALDQLASILNVTCFEAVGELMRWLRPDAPPVLPPVLAPATATGTARFGPRSTVVGVAAGEALTPAEADIVAYLFRDSARVALAPLSGGFSGARVFKSSSEDALGHQQAPAVVKLGPQALIGRERVAFERVEPILGNNAPAVRGFVDFGAHAGIKYSFAAMGQGDVRTFKNVYTGGAGAAEVDAILRAVFTEVLGPFYEAARYERLPLLEHYGFSDKFAWSVRRNVAAIAGPLAEADRLQFPGGYQARNVIAFYEDFLRGRKHESTAGELHYVSYVHGDLNAANVLLDARGNVWVIDFFHTAPGHVLKDLAKLENDLLYLMTPVTSEADMREALVVTRALRAVEDLRAPLPERLLGLESPAFLRAWQTLRTLRAIGARLCREDRHPHQMDVALLRYAVHTLSFDEASPLQKEWALAAACGLAEDVMATMNAELPLRVDWLAGPTETAVLGSGRLGLTICPGRRDRGRALDRDLGALAAAGARRLVCLVTQSELEWLGVPDLAERARATGFAVRHVPVPDQGVPEREEAEALVAYCEEALAAGEPVVIHCQGGLGRSGTLAACVLTARGLAPDEAIAAVRRARGPRAVETAIQEAFVAHFAKTSARGRA